MVTLGRMREAAEAGHIHPAYCCRAVQGLAHCGCFFMRLHYWLETHLPQKRDGCWHCCVGDPSGSRDKDSCTAVVRELDSFPVWFPTPQAGPRGKSGLVLFVVCVGCVWYVCSCASECMHTCMNLCVEARCL